MKRLARSIALSLSVAVSAHAAEYRHIVAADSAIGFSYTQMGVTLDGSFRSFSGRLQFDPAVPEAASAVLELDLASISTGMAEADAEMQDRTWFDTATFPTARFESESVEPLGDDRFEVSGTLTIKGTTRQVIAPASFVKAGDVAVFEGDFTIRRSDFAVGEGAWAKFDILDNDVRIHFRIAAAGD